VTLTNGTGYYQNRYITSSGERHWLFLLRDENGKTLAEFEAPDHPCFGNGGKPLVIPHPFPDVFEENGQFYEFERDPDTGLLTDNKLRREIIVVNPSKAQVERVIKNQTIDDETLPDLGFLESLAALYDLDELTTPAWDDAPVTVGLPAKDADGNIINDYRFSAGVGQIVTPIKKKIVKPTAINLARLKRKRV
jgi:hypothetical protein